MTKTYRLVTAEDLTRSEIAELTALIEGGGSVVRGGAAHGLRRAVYLAMCLIDGRIVGALALKRSRVKSRDKIFRRARSTQSPDRYKTEVGFAAIAPEHRGGMMLLVLCKMLDAAFPGPVFCLIRLEGMTRVAASWGFVPNGRPFERLTFQGWRPLLRPPLRLFLREGPRRRT